MSKYKQMKKHRTLVQLIMKEWEREEKKRRGGGERKGEEGRGKRKRRERKEKRKERKEGEEENETQTKLHRDLEGGMAVSIGRLRPDTQYDYKFVCLSHNTLRGAAGGAVLTAELLAAKGCFD